MPPISTCSVALTLDVTGVNATMRASGQDPGFVAVQRVQIPFVKAKAKRNVVDAPLASKVAQPVFLALR